MDTGIGYRHEIVYGYWVLTTGLINRVHEPNSTLKLRRLWPPANNNTKPGHVYYPGHAPEPGHVHIPVHIPVKYPSRSTSENQYGTAKPFKAWDWLKYS